jgi:hypothetical protein
MGIEQEWQEADDISQPVEVGRTVLCDVCNDDYTDRPESGGFIFGSYAYCPVCATAHLPRIQRYGEEGHVRAVCPEGMSFADFVRDYRGEGATIRVLRFTTFDELLEAMTPPQELVAQARAKGPSAPPSKP